MAQGLQIWDSSGRSILDTTTFVGRILAIVEIGTALSGSTSISGLELGNPFAIPMMDNGSGSSTYGTVAYPRVTFSGNTMSWQRQATSQGAVPNARLIVGVY